MRYYYSFVIQASDELRFAMIETLVISSKHGRVPSAFATRHRLLIFLFHESIVMPLLNYKLQSS